jgi:predicted chitinase
MKMVVSVKFLRKELFFSIRPLFGTFSQTQVDGLNALLDVWEKRYATYDTAICAYCLATSFHETARRMQPVRETLAPSESVAIRRLNIAYRKGQLKSVRTPYWRRDTWGRAWFGRGHVQLTHQRNYLQAARRLGVALDRDPELALDPQVSADVLFAGCIEGWFTGHKLTDYITSRRSDFLNARKVVNPADDKTYKPMEAYARAFHSALEAATASRPKRLAEPAGEVVRVIPPLVFGTGTIVSVAREAWPAAAAACLALSLIILLVAYRRGRAEAERAHTLAG